MEEKSMVRQLPSVDEILRWPETASLIASYSRGIVVNAARRVLDRLREEILSGCREEVSSSEIIARLRQEVRPRLQRVINATGVVLHTNLGRALLSQRAQEAVKTAVAHYTNLEFNLATGKRGERYSLVEELLCLLSGAEAAMVVNNNAAAVLLALNTLAAGREVIVSRGQLIEIGGSFRIPDVMRQSGAILVEVGTTNKTHRRDYREAITERTALILHVHMSNYRIIGFTSEVPVPELVALAREYNLPVMSDLGSGSLIDFSRFGLPYEPTVQETVKAGVDVVTFSGDKLLGGPQAGIIVGRREYVERMKRNPLNRALRIDKMTLAALEATLRDYLEEEEALRSIPTLKMLLCPSEELREKAERLAQMLGSLEGIAVQVIEGFSQVGGGAMPTAQLPTWLVAVTAAPLGESALLKALRRADPPVIARAEKGMVVLDPRTFSEEEIPLLVEAFKQVLAGG
ncbi:L-seryl-tRNA(Sec) selenium transferase [Ammonifex thiophilus]|uniref:L-seryl-tRNA(Sec) selenium transferase n=1 Tax=Ammonifex thiophilus TaxID=444093 RepID=A0A3D8P3J9_9THEO|nr:L-seryl-tRNA(Sec) selenium transferase [Ammonifex thiophilus]RDV83438.1 L-seryl-tRNA(Sec) selenium transferase [Ammonifex thiophilus]